MKNWIIKKLGGYIKTEIDYIVEREAIEVQRKFKHNINFPEYISEKGVLHLHSCHLYEAKGDRIMKCKEVKII